MSLYFEIIQHADKGVWIHRHVCLAFLQRGQLLWLLVCFSGERSPFQRVSCLKEKNLLLVDQILSLKGWSLRKGRQKCEYKSCFSWKCTHFPNNWIIVESAVAFLIWKYNIKTHHMPYSDFSINFAVAVIHFWWAKLAVAGIHMGSGKSYILLHTLSTELNWELKVT